MFALKSKEQIEKETALKLEFENTLVSQLTVAQLRALIAEVVDGSHDRQKLKDALKLSQGSVPGMAGGYRV